MVGMNDSGQRDRFLVDMKSGGVQVSMGTGYCGNNRKLGEVSYGRETWGSVSFSEHRIVGQTTDNREKDTQRTKLREQSSLGSFGSFSSIHSWINQGWGWGW